MSSVVRYHRTWISLFFGARYIPLQNQHDPQYIAPRSAGGGTTRYPARNFYGPRTVVLHCIQHDPQYIALLVEHTTGSCRCSRQPASGLRPYQLNPGYSITRSPLPKFSIYNKQGVHHGHTTHVVGRFRFRLKKTPWPWPLSIDVRIKK